MTGRVEGCERVNITEWETDNRQRANRDPDRPFISSTIKHGKLEANGTLTWFDEKGQKVDVWYGK